jgi:hypothetical protein
MNAFKRVVAVLASTLLFGCYIYVANIVIQGPDPTQLFSQVEQERAKTITIEAGRAAGFWQTDDAEWLSSYPSTWPYLAFVSLGAPGSRSGQRSVSILGEMRKDRREIRITVDDIERGDPLPATTELIEELRAALEQAFPDCSVEVTSRKKLHLLAP